MNKFSNKHCKPCEGGTPPLSVEEVEKFSKELGWELVEGKKIRKDFTFPDFTRAMDFVNKIASLAEREGHHPDILIHGWNKVRVELSTHAIAALSENDFIMAAKINML